MASDPHSDGFTQCIYKHDLFVLKCFIEDEYKRCPDFPQQEAEWEQEKAYSEKLAARDAGTWYIRINGKLLKDRQGQPYTFQGKAAANRAAATMMAKPFNAGKQFTLTTTAADRT